MSKYANVTSITGNIETKGLGKVNLTYLVTGKKESNFIVQKIHGLKTIDYTGSSEFSIIDLEGNKPIGACVNNCSKQVLRVEINGSNSNESIYKNNFHTFYFLNFHKVHRIKER